MTVPSHRDGSLPLIIVAGQSNAVGASTAVAELPPELCHEQPEVWFYGPTFESEPPSWAPLRPPTETLQAGTGPASRAGFGPEITAGRAITQALGGPVAVVKYAINGSDLARQWNPRVPGPLYAAMRARVDRALAELTRGGHRAVPAVVFWMQGEADTYQPEPAGAYADNLEDLIARVRHDLNAPALPFLVGRIAHAGAFTEMVRTAQARVAGKLPGVKLVETDDLERSATPDDIIHFSTRGTLDLGRRFAASYLSTRGEAG